MKCSNGLYFPDRESLAREINNITCYYDLSAELIADEIFNNKENDASISAAIIDVIAERQRQQSVEGWTPEHDDEYTDGQLAIAASCYALMGAREQFLSDGEYQQSQKMLPYLWPWDPAWWKPKGARPDLVRAGALILAELERIDRQEAAQ